MTAFKNAAIFFHDKNATHEKEWNVWVCTLRCIMVLILIHLFRSRTGKKLIVHQFCGKLNNYSHACLFEKLNQPTMNRERERETYIRFLAKTRFGNKQADRLWPLLWILFLFYASVCDRAICLCFMIDGSTAWIVQNCNVHARK